ncbi:MAG: pantetheine-phosphate adenylyltransferase [Crocinitomicaceae bacterium]|jgi:pantetheine-phosphate adenylyltransferase|nr:pantetheine-phosphate adenylyltransferase [Crocinitomicaceae bacterium]MDG1035771.1 pantetheine-phosphate adenylyltransferase [Crocinitomicaceae bacterium]MDG1742400.1 pantetheine-phosphate adenylyltransferase [Crocinitomicaceae bacterium]
MRKIGVFPGSFDPFTKGHEVIVNKGIDLFDEIVIGIGVNSAKNYMYNIDNRIKHISSLFESNPNIKVEAFRSLTVDFCKEIGANTIIRGLRDAKDFQYEKSIAHMNKEIAGIETVFFLTDQKYAAINSSIVREIHKNGGPIDAFVTNPDTLV